MSQSHRGQFGTGSLLALLALTTGSAAAETLPALRINSALLGAGGMFPAGALAESERPVTAKPAAEASPWPATPVTPGVPPSKPATELLQSPGQTVQPPRIEERPVLPALYSAHVAAGELPEPKLKRTTNVMPYVKRPGELLPTFIAADQIAGKNDAEVVAEGNVELRKRNSVLHSDRLTYWQEDDEMEATGNVRLSRDGDRVRGPRMRMKMDESTGFFDQPEYSIRRIKTGSAATLWTGSEERVSTAITTGQGTAVRMDFEGEGRYRLTDATYSTCTPAAGRDPDWFARTADLRLDYDEEVGTARNATLYFKGAPVLYTPWMSFSLNHERKSGLLTPTFGSTSRGGMEYTQPMYWNISQNMDATLSPRFMAKRGTLWNGEYRYLDSSYKGTVLGQFLAEDQIEHRRRSSYSIEHSQALGGGFSGTLNLNGASDGTFFSDLANGSSVVAQTNLLRQGTINYASTWWSAALLAQSYQTLQDPSLPPVAIPYRRLPQLTVTASRGDLPLGTSFAFTGEDVNFRNPTLVEGRRLTLYPQISLPVQTAVLTLTPKIGVHSTSYSLDRQAAGTPEKITRSVPIFSVDSGVTFERDVGWLGKTLTQTLEPRLYYLYVPVRDQSLVPIFDTGIADFNFAQIFGENRYSGGDRIGDANQATAMVTSRLLSPETGAEVMRAAFGQRFYFNTQKVGLPATAAAPAEVLRTDRQTDLLGSISGRILPKTYIDAAAQYNPHLHRMDRFNFGGRYEPEVGKLLNAGYRYSRDQLGQLGLGQIDISGQWPVFGGWHAVGRFNYSTLERRMIESVAGFEYDGGCWVGRIVMQRLATQTQLSNTALFFQLELNGFAKVGSNPLEILKRAVPGYGVINNQNTDNPLTIP